MDYTNCCCGKELDAMDCKEVVNMVYELYCPKCKSKNVKVSEESIQYPKAKPMRLSMDE